MSDFLAEARIIVRPDTTAFRAELVAQVAAATKGVTAPIQVIPIAAGNAAATAAGINSVTAAQVAGANAAQDAAQKAAALDRQLAANARRLGEVERAALAGAAGLTGLRGAVLTAGAAFLGATVAFQAGVQSIAAAAQLETQLNVFRVTTKATSEEMEAAAANARALGRDLALPGVTARDAAEAQLQLARSGLAVSEALAATRGALQFATVAQIDFSQAADLVAGNLNAFGLAGDQAVRVADLLTGAANESQGSIIDMGIGLRQVAGAADLMGLSIEETVTLLTQLTRAGLAGSDAGTTLRVALVKLANPDVRAEVESLVGSLTDLDGTLNPEKLIQFGEEINKSGDNLQQTGRLYELFGENALRVIGLLAEEGVPGFQELSAATGEAGLAADGAAARMAGFEGDMENLKNQVSSLQLEIGTLAIGPLSVLVQALANTAAGVNNLIQRFKDLRTSAGNLFPQIAAQEEIAKRTGFSFGDLAKNALELNLRMIALTPALGAATFAFDKFNKEAEEGAVDLGNFDASLFNAISRIEEFRAGLGAAARDSQGPENEGLNVQQILNRVTGLDSAEVRARIKGDNQELLNVLAEEQDFLEAQLDRDFVKRRPSLQRKLEAALLGTVNDITTIQRQGSSDVEAAANDAARAQQDADRALLERLQNRRTDVDQAGEQAQVEGNLQRAIRFEDRLQALIKQQIIKIRAQISDEKTRRTAIRELRLALIASRNEEDALRDERRQNAQNRRDELQELDIAIAQETGNDARLRRALQARINTLKKQIKAAKGDKLLVKQLQLELAQRNRALKDLQNEQDTSKNDRKEAASFFFEQLQAQQGFAANLLGNLITGPTAGLVGVPSPSSTGAGGPGRGVAASALVQEGKQGGGVSAGQANQTNDLLLRILHQLKALTGQTDAPEAIAQRKNSQTIMDGIGGV